MTRPPHFLEKIPSSSIIRLQRSVKQYDRESITEATPRFLRGVASVCTFLYHTYGETHDGSLFHSKFRTETIVVSHCLAKHSAFLKGPPCRNLCPGNHSGLSARARSTFHSQGRKNRHPHSFRHTKRIHRKSHGSDRRQIHPPPL